MNYKDFSFQIEKGTTKIYYKCSDSSGAYWLTLKQIETELNSLNEYKIALEEFERRIK